MKPEHVIEIIILILIILAAIETALAVVPIQLSDQGTSVKDLAGQTLNTGNLSVEIYDAEANGNLLWNKTYFNAIVNGSWNVMLGELNELNLSYGVKYFKDYKINDKDINFTNGTGGLINRRAFYSPLGEIGKSYVDNSSNKFVDTAGDTMTGTLNVSAGHVFITNNLTVDGNTFKIDNRLNTIGIGTDPYPDSQIQTVYHHVGSDGWGIDTTVNIDTNGENANGGGISITPKVNGTTNTPTAVISGIELWPSTFNLKSTLGTLNGIRISGDFTQLAANANITNFSYLRLEDPSYLIAASQFNITNIYGLFLEDLTNTYTGNIYPIYQTGPNGINYFGSPTQFNNNINVTNNITAYGRIGIGTQSPNKQLHVVGDANITGTMFAHNYSGNSPIMFINSTGQEIMRMIDEGRVGIGITPTEMLTVNGNVSLNNTLYVLANGRVGIGTSAPSHTLNILGDLNTTGTIYLGPTTAKILFNETNQQTRLFSTANVTEIITPQLRIWDEAEGANDYVSVYHDGNIGYFNVASGNLYLSRGGTNLVWDATEFYSDATAGTKDLGVLTKEWRALYLGEDASSGTYYGLDQNWRLWYNETSADELRLDVSGNSNFSVDTGLLFVNPADNKIGIGTTTPAQELVVVGDLNVTGTSYLGNTVINAENITVTNILPKNIETGVTVRNGSGGKLGFFNTTSGRLEVWNPLEGANDYVSVYHDGSNAQFNAGSGSLILTAYGTSLTWDGTILYGTANQRDMGLTTGEWRALYLGEDASSGTYFGLDQDAKTYYNTSQAALITLAPTTNVSIVTKKLDIWDDAEGANDYVSIFHDGTQGIIQPGSGTLYLKSSGDNGIVVGWDGTVFGPTTGNTRDLGTTTGEWRAGYYGEDASSGTYYGLDQDARIWYNNTNRSLFIESTAANVSVVAPEFRVWDDARGDGDYVSVYHDGSHGYLSPQSGSMYFNTAGTSRLFYDTTAFQPNAVNTYDLGTTGNEFRGLYLGNSTNSGIYFGMGQESTLLMSNAQATAPTLVWGLPNANYGNSLVLTKNTGITDDYDHPAQTNPTLFVQSLEDPDANNDRWTSITHDNTSAVIDSGYGNITLDDSTYVGGDVMLADNLVGTLAAEIGDDGTNFIINATRPMKLGNNVTIYGDLNVTGTAYIGNGTTVITASRVTTNSLNVTEIAYLGNAIIQTENITITNINALNANTGVTVRNGSGGKLGFFNTTSGRLEVWNPLEGANDYVSLYHDSSNGRVTSASGVLQFGLGSSIYYAMSTTALYPNAANVYDSGLNSAEWRAGYMGEDASSGTYYGLDQDSRIWYNNTNRSLFIESTAANVSVVAPEFRVWDDARGEGDYLSMYHDGTNGFFNVQSGAIGINFAGVQKYVLTTTNWYGIAANTQDLGINSVEWRGLYLGEDASSGTYFGLDQDSRIWYNNTNRSLFIESTAANVTVVAPEFRVWDEARGEGDYLSLYHDGTDAYMTSTSGDIYFNAAGSDIFAIDSVSPSGANTLGLGKTTNEWLSLYLGNGTSSGIYFGMGQESTLLMSNAQATAPTLIWGLPNANYGNSLVLTKNTGITDDYDHPAQTNPTLFVQSLEDPDANNDRWTSITHDNTSAVIDSGYGNITLDDTTYVGGDLQVADNIVGEETFSIQDTGNEITITSTKPVNFTKNITAGNVFVHQDIEQHTNRTIPVGTAGIWYNVSWDIQAAAVSQGITHTWNDGTNDTFTINTAGIYDIDYLMAFTDSAASPGAHIVGRILVNTAESEGSAVEIDDSTQGQDFMMAHPKHRMQLSAGDTVRLQFTSSATTVSLATERTYGNPKSAHISITRYR